jgi:hypothetical protein
VTLDPSPDQAHDWLRRELLRPEYNDQNVVRRLLDEILNLLDRAINAATGASTLQTVIAMATFAALCAVLGWLISKARAGARDKRAAPGVVLGEEQVSAAQLRARADTALAEGRTAAALIDGFRALTLREMERGRLLDTPGATAGEVASTLAATYPDQESRVTRNASRFDMVLYGDRPATVEQAQDVLGLDDALKAHR